MSLSLREGSTRGEPETGRSPQPSEVRATFRAEYFVTYDQFRVMNDKPDVITLPACPPPVGEGQGPWVRPGHIPGVANLPWKALMSPENSRLLKSDEENAAILS